MDVYYLMPSFAQGMIYFKGQMPAQGKLNICAVDNTLRYMDAKGQEIVAAGIDNVVKVQIDTVSFVRSEGIFYRLYPVSSELGLALRRKVLLVNDSKQGAFGTETQTSSVKEYNSVFSDGVVYSLVKDMPYKMSESLFLFKGNDVISLTKRNLQKCFPAHKADIEAWFKAGNTLPGTAPELLSLLATWSQ